MSSPLAVPNELVRDAIAKIDSDGALQPATDAMREWIARVTAGGAQLALADLPLLDSEKVAFADGELVSMAVGDGHWQLRKVVIEGAEWLLAIDVTADVRLATTELEVARNRSLGRMAATLAHDLNNQFNAVLALSAHLDEFIQDEEDRATIRELERGTKVGARMASALARLLVRRGHSREIFSSAEMFDDVLSMMQKSLQQAGVDLQVESGADLPSVRGSNIEAVQSVMGILMAFEHLAVASLRCVMSSESIAISGGRARDCAVLRCTAGPWQEATMAPLFAVLEADPGTVAKVATNPDIYEGVANALFAQKRMGGDLTATLEAGSLQLTFLWPAAR